ncbi:unnamed protein product [Adineta steineri]|uniref:Uncharacterized protein n=1 Tax=Adineta steineri TaxID=433720 RepID=A0A819D8I8_9BILA|nr:unnamed protein product [Adineta steineri]CAF3819631.1 unnamed protein product [Adineta steineri]
MIEKTDHGTILNQNLIEVMMVRDGCWKLKFNSVYPIRLSGFITEDEFHESINNINRVLFSNAIKWLIILWYILCMSGTILILSNLITTLSHNETLMITPIYIGGTVILGSAIYGIVVCSLIRWLEKVKLDEIVAIESNKYSIRSPSCSWYFMEMISNKKKLHFLVIDIGEKKYMNEINNNFFSIVIPSELSTRQ